MFDGLSKLDAILIEEDLIHHYKTVGKSYNVTDGGETSSGREMTEELRQKLSESHKGKRLSQSVRDKLSESQKGRRNDYLKVAVLRQKGDVITEYDSIKEAAKSVNRHRVSILRAIKEGRECAGFK